MVKPCPQNTRASAKLARQERLNQREHQHLNKSSSSLNNLVRLIARAAAREFISGQLCKVSSEQNFADDDRSTFDSELASHG